MSNINFFAKTDFRGEEKIFGIKNEDRRLHMYILGKTGMGKTTLLLNMIQDVLILVPQSDTINIFTLIVELH